MRDEDEDEGAADPAVDLCAYLDASPSPWHAVASSAARLKAAGFTELRETDPWDGSIPAAGYVVRGGALIAWRRPDTSAATALHIVGAHTDSPGLRVKPVPTSERRDRPRPDMVRAGWRQLGVEIYGGVLLNSWLDRDLGIAGRVVAADGTAMLVDVRAPIARVPQLAIHLDRDVNERGLVLDRHAHMTPVWATALDVPFAEWLAAQVAADPSGGLEPEWWDLCLYDVQPAAVLGADRSLLASGRLDNQVSCWAATSALAAAPPAEHTAMIALFDHEEVGSASTTGAAGPFLATVIERLHDAAGATRDDAHRALAASIFVSADNAHAVHPNYPERHDPDHAPVVNRGPAIKLNANQRYATSPETAALFRRACAEAGVPSQTFVSRNNMPCGSTIGPLTATRLGIATVDVGVPQLSMHSARELCGIADA
ncbi:MAG: M18 family aminopeptidase, partial [Actinomycetota bacterium]|nr:M18 family aminopeptidase [Actinomycetota bacterium]